jgi:hypothetical protein
MWGFYRGSPTIDTAAAINFNLSAMGGIRWVDHTGCAHEPVFGFTWTGESPAMQIAFYRAGHAHASVLTLLTMLLQNRGRLCCDPQFAGLGQSEWGYRRINSGFCRFSLQWRIDHHWGLFFTPAQFWSRRQLLRWELG